MKRLLTIAGLLVALSASAQQDMDEVTRPLEDLDERWSSGFIDGGGFTEAILASLTGS